MSVQPPVVCETPPEPFDPVQIDHAAERLTSAAHRTPVMRSRTLDGMIDAHAFLKCENLQRIGAFKFRGAYNALKMLLEEDPTLPGVIAYSSGNHAQAVALAASMLNVSCIIVMPLNAPTSKLNATRGYLAAHQEGSGELVLYDPKTEQREEIGERLAAERGYSLIPPYDHPNVIAGQGTVARELIEQVNNSETTPVPTSALAPPEIRQLDAIFVCCGGGGLLSGCAIATKAACPSCKVIGVEPALADDATRSFYSGMLHTVSNPPTIADGARTPYLGRWTYPLVRQHVDGMMTVTEQQIAWAVRFAFERLKIVIEPSGALALAGVLAFAHGQGLGDGSAFDIRGRSIGVVLSGGNIDPGTLTHVFELAGEDPAFP